MPSVLDLVRHYQHGIEKYPQDEQRVLRYIDKLFRLKVTVAHLQETGVGRTVNALRKEAGDIGRAARALVYKWKLMVAAEESDQEGDYETKATIEHNNGKDPNGDKSRPTQSQAQHNITLATPQQQDQRQTNGDNSGTKRKCPQSEEEEPMVKKQMSTHSSDDDHHNIKQVKVERSGSDSQDSSGSHSDSGSDSGEDANDSHTRTHIKTEPLDRIQPDDLKSSKHSHHRRDESKDKKPTRESSSEKHARHSSQSKSYSENKNARHSSKDSSAKDIESSSQKHKECNKDKKIKTEVTSPSKDKYKKHNEDKSSKHSSEKHSSSSQKPDSATEKNRDKNGDKSEKQSSSHRIEKEKHKSSEVTTPNEKQKLKESGSSKEQKVKEGSSSKEHKSKDSGSSSSKDKSSSSKEKSRDRSSSSKEKSRSHSDRSDKKSSSDKAKSDSTSKEKDSSEKKSSHRSRSSSHKSSSSKSKDAIPKKRVRDADGSDDGIGCESGASFAEALGMIIPAKSKKKSTPVKDFLQPGSTNSSSNDLSPAALLAPTTKLAPLPALEISALPEISPNYKPRPPPKCLPHFDEDAMNAVISSKNQRTKVYSGNKVVGKVPSLYELCVNLLQEHIDSLEYTGGVPYEILKPVIDRATPQQLFMLEHYNAYLIEDTDHLWQKHVEKHFRNKKREEMETWREMYLRCQEEQEYKLKSLTENIKLTQEAKKAPIKQTKMAYVDSVVKPPRNIARKQALHGTHFTASASPAARVASLATAPNVMRGSVRPSPSAPINPAAFNRPKKAPLMQKALQFMRGRKR